MFIIIAIPPNAAFRQTQCPIASCDSTYCATDDEIKSSKSIVATAMCEVSPVSIGTKARSYTNNINTNNNRRNLLALIELYPQTTGHALADTTVQLYKRFRDCMTSYLGGRQVDIQYTQNIDFIKGFANYLIDTKGYSQSTAIAILGNLRKVARQAIRDGLIPNLDVFPLCIAQIKGETDIQGEVKTSLKTRESVEKLVNMIEKWSYTRLTETPLTSAERRRQHEISTNYRCIALYLFGIFFYGLEIEEIITLKRCEGDDGTVYVPRYGRYLPMHPFAKRLVFIYNLDTRDLTTRDNGDLLFNTPHSQILLENASDKAEKIAKRIKRVVNTGRLSLFANGSIYDDRISYLMDCGLTVEDGQKLVEAKLKDTYGEIPNALLEKVNGLIDNSSRGLRENWYLLRLLPGQQMRTIKEELTNSGLLSDRSTSKKRVYDPIDWMTTINGKINSPLSRYLFFKVTGTGVTGVNNRFGGRAYVQRDKATRNFAIINEAELRRMQLAIRDFRDDIELIDREQWLSQNSENLKIGGKVRIITGDLKGTEATIVNITGRGGDDSKVYLLEFVAGTVTFKTELHNIQLEPINQ